jgi:hypothetical protein
MTPREGIARAKTVSQLAHDIAHQRARVGDDMQFHELSGTYITS